MDHFQTFGWNDFNNHLSKIENIIIFVFLWKFRHFVEIWGYVSFPF